MMTGLIPPSSGSVTAFGQFDTSTRPPAYLRRIGMVMGQRNQLHPDLPAIDSFKLAQAIYGIPDEPFERRLKQSLHLFEIESKLNIPVRKLSLGERMKMELILAILHEPELLFLDEPTIGLDFNAAKQIRNFLAETNRQFGITIILTSHYIKDIEELCKRVILINEGEVVYDGSLAGLDVRVQGERLFNIETVDESSHSKIMQWIASSEGQVKMTQDVSSNEGISFAVNSQKVGETVKEIFQLVGPHAIRDMTINERSLEDVFAEIYSRRPGATSVSEERD
jgi:ABC-2 type transport system ATP-binding protein